jgi:diguanylate cyclase (GGDEF)-like protein
MKKTIRRIIIIAIIVIAIVIGSVVLFRILNDKNKLTVEERNWINNSTQSVLNVRVLNDAPIFGLNGSGVFYSFINDFAKEYGLSINPITYTSSEPVSGISFARKNNIDNNDVVMYTDHFVLIGKTQQKINGMASLNGQTIGVINSDVALLNNYLDSGVTLTPYETKEALFTSFSADEITYALVPLDYSLNTILANNYEIIYHFSDIKYYYSIVLDNSTFSGVIKKYFNKWQNFEQYYNESEFAIFQDYLSIKDSEVESIKREVLKYGFVNTSPYEVIKGGTFGGINAVVLKKFSDFSKAEFSFIKYKSFDKFTNAINNNEIDLYFNRYNVDNSWATTTNVLSINYDIIARRSNNITISSLKSLKDQTLYVEANSLLFKYASTIPGVKLLTYNSEKELLKLNKKDVLILVDSNIYDCYANTKLSNYISRFSGTLDSTYNYKINNNAVLTKLLNKYISTLDKKVIITEGLENHYNTMKTGIILSTIAKYLLYLIVFVGLLLLVAIKKTRKVYIARKIKRDDKLKFIDQLTSLKNRNYLNECLPNWNNNIVYPQTIIAMDLNNLQDINDLNGYSEGDKQIKACANILIRTQLDNSEIMRTDGNEFVIYLVGYSQKQITNYIHKLNKEMGHLPYNNGAEFGYSVINDDIKTIEDALNEAVEAMKNAKKGKNNERKD